MARKTVLVCDNCGKEVDESHGADAPHHVHGCAARLEGRRPLRRLRREDARPRRRPPRPAAEGRRPRKSAENSVGSGRRTRPAATLRWEGGAVPPRGACERGQGRASPRPLSGAPRRRAVSDRAEPVGRRPGRARPARALRLPARGRDRHVRRPVRARSLRRPGGALSLTDAQRVLAVRRALAAASARRARALRRAPAASPTRCSARSASSSQGCSTPSDLDGELAVLYGAYRAELDRLGVWDRDLQRRRAAERLRSELDAWHGEPVFAYGFEDLTGAEWALLEALAGRAEVHVSLPYEPGRDVFASLAPHRDGSGGARRRPASRSCRRAPPSTRIRRSRISSAACSRRRPPPAPELDGALRFLEGAGVRGTLEQVGEELLDLLRSGVAARARSRSSPRRSSAGARRSRRCSAALGIPYAVESPRAARRDAARSRAARSCSASRGWAAAAASSSRTCARRTRGSPRSSVDYVEGRLRGRAIQTRRAGRGGGREAARGAAAGARRAARAPTTPTDAVRALLRAMIRARLRHRGAAGRGDVAARPARVRRGARRCSTSSTRSPRSAASSRATSGRRARARRRAARARPARPGGSPSSICCARARGASTSSSCSGSRRGRCRGAGARRRSSTTTRRRSLGGRLERPDQVAATATSSTPPARARRGASTSSARRRPTTARRASRARSGTRSPRSSTPRTSTRATVAAAALGAHVGARGGADRARAAAALAQLAVAEPDAAAGARRGERLGAAARPGAARCAARRGSRNAAVLEFFGAAGDVRRHRARAVRRLLVGVAVRADRLAEDDRRRGRPDAARLGRAQRAAQVLRGAAEGARLRTASTPENLERALGFLRRCLDDALRGGVRLDLTELQEAELDESLWRDLRGSSATRPSRRSRSCRAGSRSSFGSERSAPELQRGLAARRRDLPQRQDRPHRRRPVQRARDRAGLQVGPYRALGEADRRGAEAPDPAVHARAARPRRHRAARRRLPRARRRAGHARPAARPARPTTCRATSGTTTSTRTSSGRSSTRRASARSATRSGSAPATCATIRRAASARRGATSGRCAG